jgi:hypothetical protein
MRRLAGSREVCGIGCNDYQTARHLRNSSPDRLPGVLAVPTDTMCARQAG